MTILKENPKEETNFDKIFKGGPCDRWERASGAEGCFGNVVQVRKKLVWGLWSRPPAQEARRPSTVHKEEPPWTRWKQPDWEWPRKLVKGGILFEWNGKTLKNFKWLHTIYTSTRFLPPAAWRTSWKQAEDKGEESRVGYYTIQARNDCSRDHNDGFGDGKTWMGYLLEVESTVLINKWDVGNEGKGGIRNDSQVSCLNNWV